MFGMDIESFNDLMSKGGPVMWPLLALSLIGLTLVFERCWFWLRTNNAAALSRVGRLGELLRKGDRAGVKTLVAMDGGVYGRAVRTLLETAGGGGGVAAVETQRPRIERFMPTLSTIITAAPMLGILGTVMGLIGSFNVLDEGVSDPRAISPQIAEALITTAAGLVIAIVILFPYNAFRAQIDRTLGRIETLVAAVANDENPRKQNGSSRS